MSKRYMMQQVSRYGSLFAMTIAVATSTVAQESSPSAPTWQAAAGGRMAFEVASVKRGTFVPPSFPLDSGSRFAETGGRFNANFPLAVFITFAYKIDPSPDQRTMMFAATPSWVTTERFTIEGKASGKATKDQFRLMMQALLADRFKLAVHFEQRELPMFALMLVTPGKLGSRLRVHASDPACDPAVSGGPSEQFACGSIGIRRSRDTGAMLLGGRNITMAQLASILPSIGEGAVDRTVVDRTGLSGGFDFSLELPPGVGVPSPPSVTPPVDPSGTTFIDLVRQELGLKLDSTKGPAQVLRIDHVELPSEN